MSIPGEWVLLSGARGGLGWSRKGGTQVREDAWDRYVGLEGSQRWRMLCVVQGELGVCRRDLVDVAELRLGPLGSLKTGTSR